MDSPDITKIKATATSCSDSPPLQDSPFSSYINNLSPIKHVKATLVAQGLPALGSPPLVFTSPRNREASFLKRLRYPQLSSSEVPKPHDEGKKFGDGPVDSEKPISQLHMGLNTDTRDCETRNFVETQPCSSSGCGDEYLADPIEEDCVNSAQSVNPCLKQSNNVPESSIIGLIDSKEITLKLDNKNDNGTDSGEKSVEPLMTSEKAKEDLQGNQMFDAESMKIKERRDGKLPSNECPNIESGSSVENASQRKYHQDLHAQLQDIGGGRQDDCDSTPKSPPGPLQIVQVHEDCAENIGSISNGMNENMMLHASKARNNQYGMHRRCLQFEEAPPCSTGKNNSSLSPTEKVNNSESPARTVELEMVESSFVVLKTTSTKRQMATSLPPRYGGNSPLTVSKPSGIGLHLNSIVNAAPVVRGATKSIKVTDHHVSVQVIKSASIMSCHSLENVKHFPVSLNAVEKDSAGAEDRGNETETSIAAISAITHYPQTVEFKHHGPPHEKRKFDFHNADSYEECNQSSSKKKRKKTSSTIDSDGCKRCNCKKTKCLKLYCDCFAAGIYCAGSCACQGCFNREEYEDTVSETRQQIESRNPLAFAPKIVPHATEFPPNNVEGENQFTPSSARHKRGCNCKKSMCLKKYCECYQANVGCSSGCRCEGCKNVYGKKGEYNATGHSVTKEMISNKAGKERIESTFDEKLEMVATKEDLLPIELYDSRNLNPLTPSFQCSEFLPARCLPSPESDLTIISSYEKSTRSPLRNSESNDNLLETSRELLDVGSYDWRVDYESIGIMDTFSPRCDAVPTTCHLTPLSDPYSMAMASSTSSKTRDWTNASQVQLRPGNHCLSSASSLHWRSSPVTPMTWLGGTKSFQGLDSENGLYDILQDDTPEILKDTSTPIKSVKVSSPNKKRVSPPHRHNHELGASSSEGLRSGRKFILKAVPSFPPLTPCIKSTGSSTIENPSNAQDNGGKK